MMSTPAGASTAQTPAKHATYVALSASSGLSALLPLVAMRLLNEPTCRVLVFFGNYDERSDADVEELLALKDCNLERLTLHFVMEREPEEGELLNGRLDAQKLRAVATQLFDARTVQKYFMTGPAGLVAELHEELQRLGVEAARIVAGNNGSKVSLASEPCAAVAPPAQAGVTQVEVVMDGRRKSFTMHTGAESILDAAARAGIDLPFSCRAAVCSTCRTKLVRGEVELAQNYALEDWELAQGFILACQAHAKTAELEITYDEK
jgi:ring-1,2-phenylacetyl-CoA epoxidase subunit PaaE